EVLALVNVIDDAHLLRLFEGEGVARDHQLNRLALADDAAQALRASGSGEHTEVDLRQPDLPGVAAGNTNVRRHGDLQAAAHAVAVERGDHQLGRVLQPEQRLIGMQAEIVFEGWIDAGQHLDVGAGGEKFVARPGQEQDVDVVVHARLQDALVDLPVHLVGVGIGGGVGWFGYGNSVFNAIIVHGLGFRCGGCGHGAKAPYEFPYPRIDNLVSGVGSSVPPPWFAGAENATKKKIAQFLGQRFGVRVHARIVPGVNPVDHAEEAQHREPS